MTHESKYTRDGEQPITVMCPMNGAPFIPQSCYAFGARKRITMCRDLNDAFTKTFRVLLGALVDGTSNASEHASTCACDIADTLMRDMGFTLVSTETI